MEIYNNEERLDTALKMIEMHLGIFLAKEDLSEAVEKSERRGDRAKKFSNEFSKLEGKLDSNKSRRNQEYEEEFIRIYADLDVNHKVK